MVSVVSVGYRGLSSSEDEQEALAAAGHMHSRPSSLTAPVPPGTSSTAPQRIPGNQSRRARQGVAGVAASGSRFLSAGAAKSPPGAGNLGTTHLGKAVLEYQDDAPSTPTSDASSSDADSNATAAQARHSLSIESSVEYSQLSCNNVHKIWGMVKVKAVPTLPMPLPLADVGPRQMPRPRLCGVDFVVAIDRSQSMGLDNKLAFVKATIDYFVSQLDETHRFCLCVFNQGVDMVTGELLPMTTENKQLVLDKLRTVSADGSTNISEALLTCLTVLQSRDSAEQASRVASVLLFTDGLANAGVRGAEFKRTLDGVRDSLGEQHPAGPAVAGREFSPQVYNTTINTFGFGIDHDSQMLQDIAFSSRGGVYHYIEDVESIPATFGAVLDGIMQTAAHSIEVTLEGLDGARLVNFYTRFPIVELTPVKKYCVQLGSMFMGEERCVLFKLSLRKIGSELLQHRLLTANVRYCNALTGEEIGFGTTAGPGLLMPLYADIVIQRPLHSNKARGPPAVELDKHINRYTAAAAIEEAIASANGRDFDGAQDKLYSVIQCVQKSASGVLGDPYIEDLVTDLEECAESMGSFDVYVAGKHTAHAYVGMYFLERSTGLDIVGALRVSPDADSAASTTPSTISGSADGDRSPILGELQGVQSGGSHASGSTQSRRHGRSRSAGYGYATQTQRHRAADACRSASITVTGYADS